MFLVMQMFDASGRAWRLMLIAISTGVAWEKDYIKLVGSVRSSFTTTSTRVKDIVFVVLLANRRASVVCVVRHILVVGSVVGDRTYDTMIMFTCATAASEAYAMDEVNMIVVYFIIVIGIRERLMDGPFSQDCLSGAAWENDVAFCLAFVI